MKRGSDEEDKKTALYIPQRLSPLGDVCGPLRSAQGLCHPVSTSEVVVDEGRDCLSLLGKILEISAFWGDA